ncbi:MAG TPA: hypothetical protein VKI00_01505 [Mycobacterium sp.]|nr:hypothetical protein [Mycobacterium sp.]HME74359.1 hypothetical protein [Mycobacterium sp.]
MDTPTDLVVTGTTVHTLDPQTPTAEAFAVPGGVHTWHVRHRHVL